MGVVHYNTEMISMEIVTYGSWAVRCFASVSCLTRMHCGNVTV